MSTRTDADRDGSRAVPSGGLELGIAPRIVVIARADPVGTLGVVAATSLSARLVTRIRTADALCYE